MWIFCKNKNTKLSLFEQRMWNLGYLSGKHDKINLSNIYLHLTGEEIKAERW